MEDKKILSFLVVVAIVLSAASLYWTSTISKKINLGSAAITENNGSQNQPTQKVDVGLASAPFEGSADAPITIIEFSDFQCPYCGKFVTDSYPQIKSQYIDTGKAKLYFRNFPLPFHENAQKAAEATACANQQGKFWPMHDKLFSNQTALTVDNLKQYAKDLGLDTTKFNTCLDSGATADLVKKDLTDGASYGVSGTPSFFVAKGDLSVDPNYIQTQSQANQYIIDLGDNNTMIIGAQPFSEFQKAIDKALAK